MKRPGVFILVLLTPAAILAATIVILGVRAYWLFAVYTFVFTMASLLLASTLVGWSSETKTGAPPTRMRPPIERRPPHRGRSARF
ncbi:MAG: hypothetical protein ACE5IA_04375 [Dehalococcoidia bacterium]